MTRATWTSVLEEPIPPCLDNWCLNGSPNGNVYVVVGLVLYGSTDNGTVMGLISPSWATSHASSGHDRGTIFTAPRLCDRQSLDRWRATWSKMKPDDRGRCLRN